MSEFEEARHDAEAAATDPQQRNRLWWERLPMTYRPWDFKDRTPEAEPGGLEEAFLSANPWIAKNFSFRALAGAKVLEIGCGAGAASCLMAAGGANLTAVDISEAGIRLTSQNLVARGFDAVVEQMDAEDLSYPDNEFDFVFSWGVLHHSHSTERAISEVARVLKPGGAGLLMVYHRRSARYYVRGLQWLIVKRKLAAGYRLSSVQQFFTDGYFHRHFTRHELASLLEQNGLAADAAHVTHMNKRMLPGVPRSIDERLKARVGWLLVEEFHKPQVRQGRAMKRVRS